MSETQRRLTPAELLAELQMEKKAQPAAAPAAVAAAAPPESSAIASFLWCFAC